MLLPKQIIDRESIFRGEEFKKFIEDHSTPRTDGYPGYSISEDIFREACAKFPLAFSSNPQEPAPELVLDLNFGTPEASSQEHQ